MLPETHLADAGYVNGLTIQSSLGHGVNLLAPIFADTVGMARKGKILKDTIFPSEDFTIDVENQPRQTFCSLVVSVRALRAEGQEPGRHCLGQEDLFPMPTSAAAFAAQSASADSALVPVLHATNHPVGGIKTTAFRERYRRRAGIEATFSHLVNVHQARRTPYCGPAKMLCYYAALAVGVNLRRAALWEAGQRPQRKRFAYLTRILANQSALKEPETAC